MRQPRYGCCPRGAPAAEEPLSTRLLLLADLQRLAHLAARIAQLDQLLLQSADRVSACGRPLDRSGQQQRGSLSGQGKDGEK